MMKVGSSEMTRISQRVGKIAVLMGGAAAEREISLKSGRAIWQALDRSGFDAEPVVWDGKSFDGQKAHTGVYLVFCSDKDGTMSHVTKLLFVRG